MKFPKRKLRSLIGVLLSIMMSSCNLTPNSTSAPIPDYFSTKTPCDYYCWEGLLIGESTIDEAFEVVKSLEYVDQNRIIIDERETETYIAFACYEQRSGFCGQLDFVDEILTEVSISISQYSSLTLADFINSLGNPAFYQKTYGSPDICFVDIYWNKPNLSISIVFPGKICQEVVISNTDKVVYYSLSNEPASFCMHSREPCEYWDLDN